MMMTYMIRRADPVANNTSVLLDIDLRMHANLTHKLVVVCDHKRCSRSRVASLLNALLGVFESKRVRHSIGGECRYGLVVEQLGHARCVAWFVPTQRDHRVGRMPENGRKRPLSSCTTNTRDMLARLLLAIAVTCASAQTCELAVC